MRPYPTPPKMRARHHSHTPEQEAKRSSREMQGWQRRTLLTHRRATVARDGSHYATDARTGATVKVAPSA